MVTASSILGVPKRPAKPSDVLRPVDLDALAERVAALSVRASQLGQVHNPEGHNQFTVKRLLPGEGDEQSLTFSVGEHVRVKYEGSGEGAGEIESIYHPSKTFKLKGLQSRHPFHTAYKAEQPAKAQRKDKAEHLSRGLQRFNSKNEPPGGWGEGDSVGIHASGTTAGAHLGWDHRHEWQPAHPEGDPAGLPSGKIKHAVLVIGGKRYRGPSHFQALMQHARTTEDKRLDESAIQHEGFETESGHFLDREQAGKYVGFKSGSLTSEEASERGYHLTAVDGKLYTQDAVQAVHVSEYQRATPSGGTVTVKEHETKRDASSKPSVSDDPKRWAYFTKDLQANSDKFAEVGKHGDYRLMHSRRTALPEMYAVSQSGEVVGKMVYGDHTVHSGHLEQAFEVHPEHRRKGIASALLDKAEEIEGKTFKPSLPHTDRSEAFWQARDKRKAEPVQARDLSQPAPQLTTDIRSGADQLHRDAVRKALAVAEANALANAEEVDEAKAKKRREEAAALALLLLGAAGAASYASLLPLLLKQAVASAPSVPTVAQEPTAVPVTQLPAEPDAEPTATVPPVEPEPSLPTPEQEADALGGKTLEEAAQDFADSRAEFLKPFCADIQEAMRLEVEVGKANGESVHQIGRRLFDLAQGIGGSRGAVLAAAEAQSAYGHAQMRALAAAGYRKANWVQVDRPTKRDSHAENAAVGPLRLGDTWPNGQKFPGDPIGGPAENCNCLCMLVGADWHKPKPERVLTRRQKLRKERLAKKQAAKASESSPTDAVQAGAPLFNRNAAGPHKKGIQLENTPPGDWRPEDKVGVQRPKKKAWDGVIQKDPADPANRTDISDEVESNGKTVRENQQAMMQKWHEVKGPDSLNPLKTTEVEYAMNSLDFHRISLRHRPDILNQEDRDKEIEHYRQLWRNVNLKASDQTPSEAVKAASPKFGCLMAMLPELAPCLASVASQVPKEDLAEDGGVETEPHATVLYGFSLDFDAHKLPEVLSGFGPFEARIGKLSRFECPEYDVVKFEVVSDRLRALNAELAESFKSDITPSKWDYNPHVTVAYVKKGAAQGLDGSKLEGRTFEVRDLLYSLPEKQGRVEFALGEPAKASVPDLFKLTCRARRKARRALKFGGAQ